MISFNYDGHEFILLYPYVIFVVTQHNNAAFSSIQVTMLICFGCLNYHGWEDTDMREFIHVVRLVDDFIRMLGV